MGGQNVTLKKELGFSPGTLKRNHKFTQVIVINILEIGFSKCNVQRPHNIRSLTLERNVIEEIAGVEGQGAAED